VKKWGTDTQKTKGNQSMSSLENRINIPEVVLFHEADNEAVLLNLVSGKYYGLDDVGTRMWLLMTKHEQLKTVHQALLDEYQVDPQQLEQDLLALTDSLAANGLLQILEP
jgi:hypothetical protein